MCMCGGGGGGGLERKSKINNILAKSLIRCQ